MNQVLYLVCCLLLVTQVVSSVVDDYFRIIVPDPITDGFSEQFVNTSRKLHCIRQCLDRDDCKFVAFRKGCDQDCCILCLNTGIPVNTLRSGFEYWEAVPEPVEPIFEAYKEYLFALTRGHLGSSSGPCYIIALANTDTTIEVTIGTQAPTTHAAVASTPLHIPVLGSNRLTTTGVAEDKGILVQATNPIKLMVYNEQVDYMLPLPTAVLGMDYLIASYRGSTYLSDPLSSMIAIVALNDSTSVTGRIDDPIFTVTLNARQTYTYMSSGSDLSGIKVTATKPISVMSGGDCLNVPLGVPDCDPVVSHLLPRSRWGQSYVVVSMPPRTCGMLMRVMATVSSTVVTLSDGRTSSVSSRSHWEVDLTSSVGYTVDCSQPCMVWLLNKGDCDSILSDPFQIMVPAIDVWPTVPMFVSFVSGASRYLTIMALTSVVPQLKLNGNTISGWNVITNSLYSWAHVTITTDDNILNHPDPTVTVMAFMTDHSANSAYGAPAGIVP